MKVLKFTLLFVIAIFILSYCKKKEEPAPASPPPVNPLFTAGSGATDIDGNIYTSIVIRYAGGW